MNIRKKYKFFFLFFLVFLFFFISSCTCTNQERITIHRLETFFIKLPKEPENLHPIRSTDYYSSIVQGFILESFLERDKDTYEWTSSLANTWTISPDGRVFTFELYPNLKWSDGNPLTTEDVKFSFDAYKDPAYGGLSSLPYFEKLDSAKILSPTKIQFKVKETYFGNFQVIAGMSIIPKHIYKDPKTKLSKSLIGSGPYKIANYIKGKLLILKKNPLWGGQNHLRNMEKWEFKTIAIRFIDTETDTLLRMEKEHIDFSDLSAESFVEKTNHPPWGTLIKKVKYQNKEPIGYGYIGVNLKNPLFQDLRLRLALAHLLNRELMNKTFLYNQSEMARRSLVFLE